MRRYSKNGNYINSKVKNTRQGSYPANEHQMVNNHVPFNVGEWLLSFVTDYERTMVRCIRGYSRESYKTSMVELYYACVERGRHVTSNNPILRNLDRSAMMSFVAGLDKQA